MAQLSIEPNERVQYKIRYQSEHVLVIEKPAHLVTQPGIGHERSSLLNGLFAEFGPKLQQLGKDRDFGLLHRLDKETSGLVVVALTAQAYDMLRDQFELRAVRKFYWAIVKDRPKGNSGVIRKPIAEFQGTPTADKRERSGGRTLKLARISSAGKPALTAFRLISEGAAGSLVECRAVTGRLHQVRVHMASIGCPILGDQYYAPSSVRALGSRLALHAHRVAFPDPGNPEVEIDVHSPFPKDLRSVLKLLKLPKPDDHMS